MSKQPQHDPVLAIYFAKHPESLDEALAAVDKIDGRSVNQRRECKIILWRLAAKIADSGLTLETHKDLYERLKRNAGI